MKLLYYDVSTVYIHATIIRDKVVVFAHSNYVATMGIYRSNEKSFSRKISGTDLNALTTEVVILYLGVAAGMKISGSAAVEEDFAGKWGACSGVVRGLHFRRAVSKKASVSLHTHTRKRVKYMPWKRPT